MAQDLGKSYLPRLSFKKGEPGFIQIVGGLIAGTWQSYGAVVDVKLGRSPTEAIITWSRCPWPAFAKEFNVAMKEDLAGCNLVMATVVNMANAFMGTDLKVETMKAIPRSEGACVRRLYK